MEQPKNPVPQWLQNLQDNSWEIELLISGGAVFTLLQFPDLFLNFMRTVKITSDLPGTALSLIMGMACIKILTNGFILHLLLRAFWLAMVCINYIYPQGIDGRKMQRAYPFRSRHVEGDLREQIMHVDRLSGLVIFMTIISSIIVIGFLAALILILFSIERLEQSGGIAGAISEAISYLLLVYFVDLLSMGFIRRIPVLAWVLFPFFYLFDILTFRSFYARPLAMFSSNVQRPAFVAGAMAFILITGVTTYIPLARGMHWPRLFDARQYRDQLTSSNIALVQRYYADQCDPNRRGVVSIPSHLIENNYLQVNLLYDRWMDGLLDNSHPQKDKRFLSDLIEIKLDDSLCQNIAWMEVKAEEDSQIGLVAILDISQLPNGAHKVKIQSKELPNAKYMKVRSELLYKVSIPFWKDVH
ncbi:MAG TPA: hypothetical protein PK509_04660 [Catalimonadaceae bacterium]|nr:hypothetical protein [Catalimonadaceae bacterium]HPI10891.1 hypothetical protein [Catalimonadaceae bacterium]